VLSALLAWPATHPRWLMLLAHAPPPNSWKALTLYVCAASPAGSISAVNVMMAAERIRDFILVVLPD